MLSLYSSLHLAVAMVVALMALIHGGMWLALRSERAQLWVAVSFVGFALLDAALAGCSSAALGGLGPVAPWVLMTVPTALFLPFVLMHTAWAVFDLPATRGRKTVAWVSVVLVAPEAVNVIWLVATGHPAAATWESSRYDFPWAAIPYQVALAGVGAVWVVAALQCWSSVPGLARLALVAVLPAIVITSREALLFAGFIDGPTWIGLTGLPLAAFASGALVARHVAMVREATQLRRGEDRYRRVYPLARGGMGEVWLGVRHAEGGFRRFVVLKRIRLDGQSEEAIARLVAEARVAARLHHPNIVAVHDFGRFDAGAGQGGWFIVMEYLAGASLYDVLQAAYEQQKAVPPEVIVALAVEVLRGLECAHGHGILHRDVSPDNVIVTFEGAVKLVDFGIAKETRHVQPASPDTAAGLDRGLAAPGYPSAPESPSAPAHLTAPGRIAGKRRYLPPERMVVDGAVAESDLFSLALVLLELFGVELPSTGADLADCRTPLGDAGLQAPGALESILARALAAQPRERFRSAAALGAQMRSVARGLPLVDLGAWVRDLCAARHDVACRLAELDAPTVESVEAVFSGAGPPTTVQVSPANPGIRPGWGEPLAGRLVAVGPKVDAPAWGGGVPPTTVLVEPAQPAQMPPESSGEDASGPPRLP